MWSEQSVDNSHDQSHAPGLLQEESANEEDDENSAYEHLADPAILEPEQQVARSSPPHLVALTIHGIADTDWPVGCSLRRRN
jgi:hypothetical protein